MPAIPPFLLKQLYVKGSLTATGAGWHFTLRNNLATGTITALRLAMDGNEVLADSIGIIQDGRRISASAMSTDRPVVFAVASDVVVEVVAPQLGSGVHMIEVMPITRELGAITIQVQDEV